MTQRSIHLDRLDVEIRGYDRDTARRALDALPVTLAALLSTSDGAAPDPGLATSDPARALARTIAGRVAAEVRRAGGGITRPGGAA